MTKQFEMIVNDIFCIGKHTVFVGPIEGGAERIQQCLCDLILDGEILFSDIPIENEDLGSGEERSLRTTKPIQVDRSLLERGRCTLVFVQDTTMTAP